MSTISRFRNTELICVWAGDDQAMPQFGGSQIVIPPINKVAVTKVPGTPYRYPSAVDRNGQPVPGTVLIKSDISVNPVTGGLRHEFDAISWAEGVEGVASGKALMARGFSIVASVEEVADAQREGRLKWEAKQRESWRRVIEAERHRQQNEEKNGHGYTEAPNQVAVLEAIEGLRRLEEQSQLRRVSIDDLNSALGLPSKKTEAQTPVVQTVSDKTDMEHAAKLMFDAAEKANVNLTKSEMAGLFKADPAVIDAVDKKLAANGVNWTN